MITQLPTGAAARHPLWPEARWNVSGLFVHGQMLLDVFHVLRDRFDCRLSIDSIHGAPGVPWNSGRLNTLPVPRGDVLTATIESFNNAGIGVFFTFSNHLLEASDLADPVCNGFLDTLDNGLDLNGVILSSDVLFEHIRQTHPDLKLTASVVKVANEDGGGKPDYYQAMLDRFDSVMLHPDDGFNLELLDQLERDRIEILINENCAYGCPNRMEDYALMSALQKAGVTNYESTPLARHDKEKCRMPLRRLTPTWRSSNFTPEEMQAVYGLGYRRFKLQGRQDKPPAMLFDLLRYTIEPEILMPRIFKVFISGAARKIVAALADGQTSPADADGADETNVAEGQAEPAASELIVAPTPQTDNHRLPTGQAALAPFWPEARWNISGLFVHGNVICEVLALLGGRYDCRPIVDSLHGAPGVAWNSGRLISLAPPKPEQLAHMTNTLNRDGIGVFFTFSNHLLEPDDLNDPVCNQMLEVIDNQSGLNGVILASDLLYDYLRDRHPSLALTASIIKVAVESGRGDAAYYRAMTDRYDSVMLHPDDALNPSLLEQLEREKIEILVNENCRFDCPARADHYFRIGGQQKDRGPNQADGCLMQIESLRTDVRSCNLSTAEMKRVYDLGYRRFKLQGRRDNALFFLYDLLRYTLEPNLLMPVIYKAFVSGAGREHAVALLTEAQRNAEQQSAG